jgi:hypothetical protein
MKFTKDYGRKSRLLTSCLRVLFVVLCPVVSRSWGASKSVMTERELLWLLTLFAANFDFFFFFFLFVAQDSTEKSKNGYQQLQA